ncbi:MULTISPECIES: hypothetical protein [Actinomycetes]|uniref:hypothetical protein n=1 Tax=Actinomycetes TaxID=1760 RepID=UPI0005ECA811|nr:hypothetical protein [Saccharothrix sp. ST-888]KJK55464.1 membrane protein [Saccharothrix sp. ST-888]
MVLSVSALVLFGALVFIFIRNKQLKTSHAVISALFGFMLSASTAAEPIRNFLSSVAKSLQSFSG